MCRLHKTRWTKLRVYVVCAVTYREKNVDTSRTKRDKIFRTSLFHIDKHGWSGKQICVSTIMFNRSGNLSDAHAQTVQPNCTRKIVEKRKKIPRPESIWISVDISQRFPLNWTLSKKKNLRTSTIVAFSGEDSFAIAAKFVKLIGVYSWSWLNLRACTNHIYEFYNSCSSKAAFFAERSQWVWCLK